MAKGSTSSRRRRRWIVLLVLVGAAAWFVRSLRSGAAAEVTDPWHARPEPAEPAPVAAVEPEAPAPTPTPRPRPRPAPAAEPSGGGAAPGPEYTIKGNADSMLFHTPSSPYYGRTKADAWFRTAEEASAAGFTEWTPKKRTSR